MKKLIAAFTVLALSSCTSLYKAPCENLEVGCGVALSQPSHKRQGLDARYTVQNMLSSMLINGVAAQPSEWPASVYAYSNNGTTACSATLIGERVAILAGHCAKSGDPISFTAHANKYTATCTNHPDYVKGNQTADWNLCLVDRPVTGVPFEVLGVNEPLALKDILTLSGYGCIHSDGTGGNDGIFRIGNATISALPGVNTNDIITKGSVAICFGDSGGAAFKVHSDGTRPIVGINSRGDINTTSWLPSIASKSFVDWATDWAKNSNNVRICGLHSDASNCRTGSEAPAPDAKFDAASSAACVKGVVSPSLIDKKDEIVEKIQAVIDSY